MVIKYDEDDLPYLDYGNGIEWHMELEDVEGIWKEKAEIELRETPENVEKALKELRSLVLADDELFMAIEKEFLLRFLRPCKFYAKSAYEKIRNYYKLTQRCTTYPLTPLSLQHISHYGILLGQPVRDQYGQRIGILRFGKYWDTSKVSIDDIRHLLVMGVDTLTMEPMTQVNGIVNIIDLEGFGLKHAMQWTPMIAYDLVNFALSEAPMRLKAIHIVNAPTYINALLRIVRPFLSAKLRSRMFIHRSPKCLLEHIDAKCLRKSYGGELDLPEDDHLLAVKFFECFEEEFKVASRFGLNKAHKVPVYDGMFYQAAPLIKKFKEKEAKKNKQNGGYNFESETMTF